ncbi:MAG: hypothetical protein H7222_13110 [Methylotenera sp.]|nr:hypothetical protein [Oligoflexia bacterium]
MKFTAPSLTPLILSGSLLLSVFSGASVLHPSSAFADDLGCEKVLTRDAARELAGVREDFRHTTNYTVEVSTTAIRNQKDYGGCWIYGTLADIEAELRQATGEKVDLSEQYVIMTSIVSRAMAALRRPGGQISQGGDVLLAQKLIRKFGLVPAHAWQPVIPFEEGPHSERMMYFLNSRIAEFHLGLGSYKTAAEAEKGAKIAEKDIFKIISTYFGVEPPSEFTYRGAKYTPQSFAQKFYAGKDVQLVSIFPRSPAIEGPLRKMVDQMKPLSPARKAAYQDVLDSRIVKSLRDIEDFIVGQLKKGHVVPIGVEIADAFIDNRSGIMSIGAFHTPEGFKIPPREYRDNFGLAGGGHMILIVGADVDAAGKVIKFKIKNSWGKGAGDEGYYHMYADYFEQFLQVTYAELVIKP